MIIDAIIKSGQRSRNPILNPRHTKPKAVVALLLTLAAGFVDVVGVLSVYKLFTAHMTGTTVHLGEQLIEGNWPAATAAAIVIAAFLIGSILGRVMIEAASRAEMRRVASFTLVLEGVLLASVAWWGSTALENRGADHSNLGVICCLLAMMAAAMGLQTATLTRIGPLTIHTTFVTGMLNKLAQLTALWVFLTRDLHRHAIAEPKELRKKRAVVWRRAKLICGIWLFYLVGAVCGTWASLHWQLRSLYLPCVILFCCRFDRSSAPSFARRGAGAICAH